MLLRKSLLSLCLILLASCSTVQDKNSVMATESTREPAEAEGSCVEMAQNIFLKDNYQEDLQAALVSKKLLSFSNKFVTIEHPRLDWINRARASLNKSIKNWNNNKYPAFYIFSDEEVVTEAKRYFQTIHSMVNPDIAIEPEAAKNLELVANWSKSFSNYQKELDELLEERISLQYNLSLLKKLKLKEESRDIKLSVKRNGVFVDEIVTLRKSDKDLAYQVKKIKSEIADLDGALLQNGKIKDRVIKQAMLADILTIIQREFEYGVKNTPTSDPELLKELAKLNTLIKTAEFQPSTYGVYRITNKVFIRELYSLSKLDVAYKKFAETPLLKLKEVVNAFIENRPVNHALNQTEEEKIGFFKRVYAKIKAIPPKTLAIAGAGTGGTVGLVGLGIQRYFWVNKVATVSEDRGHEEQLERTKQEDVKKSEGHSTVVEVQLEELTNP